MARAVLVVLAAVEVKRDASKLKLKRSDNVVARINKLDRRIVSGRGTHRCGVEDEEAGVEVERRAGGELEISGVEVLHRVVGGESSSSGVATGLIVRGVPPTELGNTVLVMPLAIAPTRLLKVPSDVVMVLTVAEPVMFSELSRRERSGVGRIDDW